MTRASTKVRTIYVTVGVQPRSMPDPLSLARHCLSAYLPKQLDIPNFVNFFLASVIYYELSTRFLPRPKTTLISAFPPCHRQYRRTLRKDKHLQVQH